MRSLPRPFIRMNLFWITASVLFSGFITALASFDGNDAHINTIKSRILLELGIIDPSLYTRYDIVWPQQTAIPYRTPRDIFIRSNNLLHIGMELFGKHMLMVLEKKNLTSPTGFETTLMSASGVPYVIATPHEGMQCHYRGRAEICVGAVCETGTAAISTCGEDGRISGYLKLDGDNVQLRPLPESVVAAVEEAAGAHLAKKLDPLEQWDELRELGADYNSLPFRLPIVLDSSLFLQKIRDKYGFSGENDIAFPPSAYPIADDIVLPSSGNRLVLEIAAFVDQTMANKLQQDYSNAQDQVNAILAAFNAVQVIFDDKSFGDPKVRLFLKRIIIDQTGKTFKGEGEAESYLKDLCDYQNQLVQSLGKQDWTILVALTGIDIFGVLDDVLKDSAYASIKFPDNRVYGVAGLTFTGQACRARRNCVVAEFWKEMGNVDTMAHEIGHTLGMNHDGTGNTCSNSGGNLMSLSTTKQRSGWSTCSVKSFHDFLSQGKGACLAAEGSAADLSAMTNG